MAKAATSTGFTPSGNDVFESAIANKVNKPACKSTKLPASNMSSGYLYCIMKPNAE